MIKAKEIDDIYLCSITGQIMRDPVVAADGHTYEREAIEAWFQLQQSAGHGVTSALHGGSIINTTLTVNQLAKKMIDAFLTQHPEHFYEVYLPESMIQEFKSAIENNQQNKVQELAAKDRRLLTIKLHENYPALHLASQFGSPKLVDFLLTKLREINQLEQIINQGKPADIIPNFNPVHLNALLQNSLEQQDLEKSNLLLQLGAELEQPDHMQNTLLHRMILQNKQDNLNVIRWLLSSGANKESCNTQGNTPLLLSIINNSFHVVKLLLENKVNQKVINHNQETPISIAILNKNQQILTLLVGANNAQLSPIHLALELNDLELLKILLNQTTIPVGDLLEVFNSQQQTPLYAAVLKNNLTAVELLLKYHANPTVVCGTQQATSLHLAVENCNLVMLKLLLPLTFKLINVGNCDGDTPLHLAANLDQSNFVVELLNFGADHRSSNNKNQTPIELARQQQKVTIANLIEQTARDLKGAKFDKMQQEARDLLSIVERQATEIKQQAAEICQLKISQNLQPLYTGETFNRNNIEGQEKEAHEQTARDLKGAKFYKMQQEIRNLLSIVERQATEIKQQAAEICQLKISQNLQLLYTEETFNRNNIEGQEKEAHGQLILSLRDGIASITRNIELERARRRELILNNLNTFLHHIGFGEQDEAEALLKTIPDLALERGTLTDCADRVFNGITGFQYALWALDWHMWQMLLKYMPPEAITEQLQTFNNGNGQWVAQNGTKASWQDLIDALNTFCNANYRTNEEWENHWCKKVGGAQLLLPAHVINEYSRLDRPFNPCPAFSEATLPRGGAGKSWKSAGEWLLVENFAWVRGARLHIPILRAVRDGSERAGDGSVLGCVSAWLDARAVSQLFKKRTEQLTQLITTYQSITHRSRNTLI